MKKKKTFQILVWTHRTRRNPSGRRDVTLSFHVAVTTTCVQVKQPLLPSSRSAVLQTAIRELSLMQHLLRSSAMQSNELRPLLFDQNEEGILVHKKGAEATAQKVSS
jgi:hypothetical protein